MQQEDHATTMESMAETTMPTPMTKPPKATPEPMKMDHGMNSTNNLHKVLSKNLVMLINEAIEEEYEKNGVLHKVFDGKPLALGATEVTSNQVFLEENKFRINESDKIPVPQFSCRFSLSQTQMENLMNDPSCLITLATSATNALVFGFEIAMLRGKDGFAGHPISKIVKVKSGRIARGVLEHAIQRIQVPPTEVIQGEPIWGINTYSKGVAKAISLLSSGQNQTRVCSGDYELVLTDLVTADIYFPVAEEKSTNAGDRIKEIVRAIHSSNALPELTGLFICKGGPSVNLCMAQTPTANFLQVNECGDYLFEVAMKGTNQVIFESSLIRLDFVGEQSKKPGTK